jgi:hypothetical protein
MDRACIDPELEKGERVVRFPLRSPLFLATLEPALERSEGVKFLTFAFWLQLCALCSKRFLIYQR